MKVELSSRYIKQEARSRGIEISEVTGDCFSLKYGNHEEYFSTSLSSQTTSIANLVCRYKDLTKKFLGRAGVVTPRGVQLKCSDDLSLVSKAIEENDLKWPLVLKPASASLGDGVYTGIKDEGTLRSYWLALKEGHMEAVIEEEIQGEEHRVFATREKALSVTKRVPAYVVGDGKNSIEKLIEIKNSEPVRSGKQAVLKHIIIDQIVRDRLAEQGLGLESIIKEGQTVALRGNSNIATGGESVDCTDIAHPSVGEIAVRAVRAIPGLLYGGVDFMSTDITAPQTESTYCVIEVNSGPDISVNQTPAVGQGQNIAKEVIDLIFPETKTIN